MRVVPGIGNADRWIGEHMREADAAEAMSANKASGKRSQNSVVKKSIFKRL
jgi:hypothetical protein